MQQSMTESPGVLRLRRALDDDVEAPILPSRVRFCAFDSSQAKHVHTLLDLAYANGEGSVSAFADWWEALSGDAEYDPALCILACDGDGRLVGVAQCWTSAFVKDLAVHPQWRRCGVGRALLLQVFATFRRRGAPAVDLKVRVDNADALAFYESMGMRPV